MFETQGARGIEPEPLRRGGQLIPCPPTTGLVCVERSTQGRSSSVPPSSVPSAYSSERVMMQASTARIINAANLQGPSGATEGGALSSGTDWPSATSCSLREPSPSCLIIHRDGAVPDAVQLCLCHGAPACVLLCVSLVRPCAQGCGGRCPPGSGVTLHFVSCPFGTNNRLQFHLWWLRVQVFQRSHAAIVSS